MTTVAVPLRDESSLLVAVIATGFTAGTNEGAMYSTLPESGPEGGTHGFVPVRQIWPTSELPLGTPFTIQVAVVSGVFVTIAAKLALVFTATVAVAGLTETVTLLVIVTVADAVTGPPLEGLNVAWTVTGFVAGKSTG